MVLECCYKLLDVADLHCSCTWQGIIAKPREMLQMYLGVWAGVGSWVWGVMGNRAVSVAWVVRVVFVVGGDVIESASRIIIVITR